MRATWQVYREFNEPRHYGVRLQISKGQGSYSFQYPIKEKFPRKPEAEAHKKTLPQPIVQGGIVLDGVTTHAVFTMKSGRRFVLGGSF